MYMQNTETARSRGGLRFISALLAFAAVLLCLSFACSQAWADPEGEQGQAADAAAATEAPADAAAATEAPADATADPDTDDASAAESGDTPTAVVSDNVAGMQIGGDIFLAQQTYNGKDIEVKDNFFLAAQTVTLSGGKTGADAFVAGQDVQVTDLTVDNNIFAAGNNVTLTNVTGDNLFLTASNVNIDATANNAFAAGNTVFLKGTYSGNVYVTANNVIVDPYLNVKGNLTIEADQEPTIAETTTIGNYTYKKLERSSSNRIDSFSDIGSEAWIWYLVMTLISMLVVGIIMLLVLRTEVVDATGALLKDRPLAIFLTGLLTLILMPVLIAALFITQVAWPIALALCFGYILVICFSVVYTAISLGRAIFGRINKWVSSIIMLIIFALLMSIPIVDFVLGAICTLYFSGCVIQGWWVWRRNKRLGADDSYDDFAVPRGTHADTTDMNTVQPSAYAPTVASTASTEYQPRAWNE